METVEAFGLEEEDDSSEDGTFDEDELADEPAHEPKQAPVFHTLQNVDYNQMATRTQPTTEVDNIFQTLNGDEIPSIIESLINSSTPVSEPPALLDTPNATSTPAQTLTPTQNSTPNSTATNSTGGEPSKKKPRYSRITARAQILGDSTRPPRKESDLAVQASNIQVKM
jgi:hypothetical protein